MVEIMRVTTQTMQTVQNGQYIDLKVILSEKKLMPKSNGGNYLSVSLVDKFGKIDNPVFDEAEKLFETLKENTAYTVGGIINIWNGNVQIKNIVFKELGAGEYEASDFINSYEITDEMIEEFEKVVNELEPHHKSIVMMATGCCGTNKKLFNNFLKCPSAEKHHGNRLGGLFLHTMGVMSNIVNMLDIYVDKINVYGPVKNIDPSRLLTKAILHDIMKMKEYDYNTIIRRKPGKKLNHLIEGVVYLSEINSMCGNVLSEEEIDNIGYAILSHHGSYGPYEPKETEDMLLHLADMIDSRIVGEIEK